jgi:RimJ/RimL family protein N-acetyltransferase
MQFELQPTLQNELIRLQPLQESDFEKLYEIASDPLLWEQHPNKDRYKREVFEEFFFPGLASGGAFLIIDNKSGEAIGSSRYYDLQHEKNSVAIGYTFLARAFWGGAYNYSLKKLMLDHAFIFVPTALFHIGFTNKRSQKAIEKLGARQLGAEEIAYYGEQAKPCLHYVIEKESWENRP